MDNSNNNTIIPFSLSHQIIKIDSSYHRDIKPVIIILALKNAIVLYKYRRYDFKNEFIIISCQSIQRIKTLADQIEVNRITIVILLEENTSNKEELCRLLK